ncbi:hypothetical protein [Sphingomonas sp. LR55]|uniref:hypothetical protein n=1 Tax=Sphingomonas sp. LR55 TaxID=3050231 RepID=UPI002FE0E7DD
MPPSGVGVIRSLSGAVKAMFQRRWRTFVAVAATVLVVGIALVMMMPWRYEAVARVKIDPSANAALGRMDGERPDQNIFDTEVNVVKSRDVAIGVVRKLGLANRADLTKGLPELPRNPTPEQEQKRVDMIASRLLSKISADRDKMTYVVNIGYTAADRLLAAEVANGFASEYIAYSRGQRTGAASRETSYLDQRLAALNQQAALADARLAQYRAQAGIVGGGSSTVTDQQISPLAGQLATAESEAAAAQARLAVAGSQIASGGIDAVSAVLDSEGHRRSPFAAGADRSASGRGAVAVRSAASREREDQGAAFRDRQADPGRGQSQHRRASQRSQCRRGAGRQPAQRNGQASRPAVQRYPRLRARGNLPASGRRGACGV